MKSGFLQSRRHPFAARVGGSTVVIGALSVLCFGCSRGKTDWMPLDSSAKWSYEVRNARNTMIGDIAVLGQAPVANFYGARLSSPSGDSVLGWRGGILYARELSGIQYDPPLPLLDAGAVGSKLDWKGSIYAPLAVKAGSASTETSTDDKFQLNGRPVATLKSTINLVWPGSSTVVETWFASGKGIVRQVCRTNGFQTSAMRLLSGP